jgi:hypothetical protein
LTIQSYMVRRVLVQVCLASALALGGAAAQEAASGPAAWRTDLELLAEELPRRHPLPFANIARADWDAAVADLDARLPSLDRNEWVVELQRLVALLGDAHTALDPRVLPPPPFPPFPIDPAGRGYYPLDFFLFDDGLFIRRASPEYASLAGARVVRIGDATTDEALAAVGTTISHENEWWIKASAPWRLTIPETLDGLGLLGDGFRLELVIERDGETETVTVTPVERRTAQGHGGGRIDRTGWSDMLESSEPPLWLRHPDRLLWYEYLPDTQMLYVRYRAIASPPHGPSNREFWDEVFSVADGREVGRFVIDLRHNGGGNGFFNRNVVQQLVRRPEIDRPDVLYVIIDRGTFSAAQQLTNDLEWWTQATFVGEPTGQKPSQFGDHRPLVLPNSGITVNISTVFHQAPNPLDQRDFVPPDIYTPLTSSDYRSGNDPALAAILSPAPATAALASIQSAIENGDIDRAERILEAARNDVANHFQSFEADLNSLGYRLLGEHRAEVAIAVFELNTRAYPESANTFDSLGEALATVGLRDEAVAAYRRALEIDPNYPPSVAGLRRLEEDE